MTNGSRRKQILDYALGMVTESVWILVMTGLALLMAVAAKALWP